MRGSEHSRLRGSSQRGGGRLRAIVWTLILVSIAYSGFKIVPPYFANYQLTDKMENVARFATVNHRSDEELRDEIYNAAKGLDIPVHREDVKILENTSHAVRFTLDYSVLIDLKVYQWNKRFTLVADNRGLY